MNAIYAESVQDHEFADETLRLMNVMQRRNCNAHPAQYWQFSEYAATRLIAKHSGLVADARDWGHQRTHGWSNAIR